MSVRLSPVNLQLFWSLLFISDSFWPFPDHLTLKVNFHPVLITSNMFWGFFFLVFCCKLFQATPVFFQERQENQFHPQKNWRCVWSMASPRSNAGTLKTQQRLFIDIKPTKFLKENTRTMRVSVHVLYTSRKQFRHAQLLLAVNIRSKVKRYSAIIHSALDVLKRSWGQKEICFIKQVNMPNWSVVQVFVLRIPITVSMWDY